MTADGNLEESFAQFKNSFSYGSRTDLNFKFMKGMSDEVAAKFLQDLLWLLGDAADSGDLAPVLQLWYESQVAIYAPKPDVAPQWRYDDAPWTPVAKPLREIRLALVSAGGAYVAGDDPLGNPGPAQEDVVGRIQEFLRSEPTLSRIPDSTPRSSIRVRHPGYDVRSAQRDFNTVFPLDRLHDLVADGTLGDLSPVHFGFVGAASQLRLRDNAAPRWAEALRSEHIEAVLLVAT